MKARTTRIVGARAALGAVSGWTARHVLPFLAGGVTVGLLHLNVVHTSVAGLATGATLIILLAALVVREILLGRRDGPRGGLVVMRELRLLVPCAAILGIVTSLGRSADLELGALTYLFALVAVTFFSRGASVPAILFVTAIQWLVAGGPPMAGADLNHRLATTLFMAFFAAFALAFLRTEVVRLRAQGKERIEAQLNRITQLARDYRLMSVPSSNASEESSPGIDEEEEKRRALRNVTASLHEIHSTIYTMLDVIKRTLRLHTCVLLFKDDAGEYLKILEIASDSTNVTEAAIPAGFGLTGVVASRGEPLSFCPFPESTVIPYYDAPEHVASLCAIPVHEERNIRGVLCADRLTEDPFTETEREVLATVAAQAVRVICNERIFLQLAKSKTEQSRLYQASTKLRAANSCEEVLAAAFESARSIVSWELAAATRYDPVARRHHVIRAEGAWADQLAGLNFADNDGLVSQAVRMRYHLPYKGQYDPTNMTVMTRRIKFKGARSLMVLPLVVRDRAIGTLVLASSRDNVFTVQARPLLQVIADQTALSYHNALMVRRLEEMASTDGLTGLHNKRVFLEALGRKLRAADRFGKPLSLILTDLDKFKSVNDTYGHQVGDDVLKRFAQVLGRNAREVDMACRYGGEEFAIICEETDSEGAFMLAERIRADMQRESFTCPQGTKFKVTCSLGVATGPVQGSEPEDLIRNADEALYEAKRSGRNRALASRAGLLKTG